jgi:hypothetical protein
VKGVLEVKPIILLNHVRILFAGLILYSRESPWDSWGVEKGMYSEKKAGATDNPSLRVLPVIGFYRHFQTRVSPKTGLSVAPTIL